jgi:hypothetical protein
MPFKEISSRLSNAQHLLDKELQLGIGTLNVWPTSVSSKVSRMRVSCLGCVCNRCNVTASMLIF